MITLILLPKITVPHGFPTDNLCEALPCYIISVTMTNKYFYFNVL